MQVRDFLHPYALRKSPQHWWCKPPVQPLKLPPQPAPKTTLKAAKPAPKAAPKAASVPAKISSQAPAAKRLQAPVTQRGRVTKLPARLASDGAAGLASSADEDVDATAGGAAAVNTNGLKQKPRKSLANPRSSNKTLHAGSAMQLGAMPSQAADLDANLGEPLVRNISGPSVLSAAMQPAPHQVTQPAHIGPSKHRKVSVSGRGVNQASGAGSGFLAKALGQLMDDGHLLEALQDLLAAMPKQEPASPLQNTSPSQESTPCPQAAPSNLGNSIPSLPEAKLDAEARKGSACGAELGTSAEAMPAAKTEELRVSAGGLPGSESAIENAGQRADPDHIAQQAAEEQSAAASAPVSRAILPKRLKGGAAVLAKVLGLNMLAPSLPQGKNGTTALQSG